MGCLKKLIKRLIIIALIVAFFMFGGWTFVKGKIKQYQYPPREVFIETEAKYADFSDVSSDYQLYRSYNFFGYKKINAKYLPTGQKITIFDLKDEDLISVSDFYTGEIKNKIDAILEKTKDALIAYDNFEIIKQGKFKTKDSEMPYLIYKANVRNIPFKDVVGTISVYSNQDTNQKASTKLIMSVVSEKAYNPKIVEDFVLALGVK